MKVFISHAKKDLGIYSALCLALDNVENVDRWKENLSPGNQLSDQLREAIWECHVCVFIVTRASIKSQWCLAELGAFWGASKKVFLFLGHSKLSDSDLPKQFRGSYSTNDANELIENLKMEASKPCLNVHERPANLFWLGHDFGRLRELVCQENEDIEAIEEMSDQAAYHFNQLGYSAKTDSVFDRLENAKESHGIAAKECIGRAIHDLGDRIEELQQLPFRTWANNKKQKTRVIRKHK